jgi:signal transduction histidine kinase
MLLANMTHELARPLGGLGLGIESLRSGAMDERETGDSLLNEMEVSIQRMESLIEDLAVSARPKSLPLKLRFSKVALGPFLHGLRSRLARRAALRDIQLTLSVPEALPTIEADEMRLFQIMGNLADNALKFTPTGGAVDISAQLNTSQVTLTICDSGPGIPPDQVDRLLEPFAQGDTVSEVRQGMGLGLSIANELVQAHGGRLRLGQSDLGGLQASVILPLGARPTTQTGS